MHYIKMKLNKELECIDWIIQQSQSKTIQDEWGWDLKY